MEDDKAQTAGDSASREEEVKEEENYGEEVVDEET